MVNFSLEGKIALVTGASYGIGFGIASAYAEAQSQHMQENHVHARGMGTGEEDPRALGKEYSGV